MDANNSSFDEPQAGTTKKKPYEKPSFRYEKVFVTTALNCGKIGNEATCMHGGQSAS
jgi:hypothetical protein